MSYADIAALSRDTDFLNRTAACFAGETLDDPAAENADVWATKHSWQMASTPGFGAAYESAVLSGIGRPGLVASVISDNQILAAVQYLRELETPG
jgi:hypothetical protein